MKKLTSTQKTIIGVMLLGLLCLCTAPFLILPTIDFSAFPTSVPTAPPTPTIVLPPTPLKFDEIGAQVQCRQFIRDRLRVPSSAEFSREKVYGVEGKADNYHAVTGVVESQNALGVMLASPYRCYIHYIPENSSTWILDDLEID